MAEPRVSGWLPSLRLLLRTRIPSRQQQANARDHVRPTNVRSRLTERASRCCVVQPRQTRPAYSQAHRPSLRRRGDMRPFFHLHAGDELVATALGAEEGGLAFFDVKPILAESIDDVRLVRNENRVGARRRYGAEQLVKSVDAAVILVRRHHETALGNICGLLDILEARDDRGLVCSVVLAGIDLADRNPGLTDGVAESLRQGLALVVEISLGRSVVEVERIGVRLIR